MYRLRAAKPLNIQNRGVLIPRTFCELLDSFWRFRPVTRLSEKHFSANGLHTGYTYRLCKGSIFLGKALHNERYFYII